MYGKKESDADILKRARRMVTFMQAFKRTIGKHPTLNTAIAFVTIALNPGITIGEVQEACGLPRTATARAISVLFEWARGQDGLDLVSSETSREDGRVKHLYLTDAGQRAWAVLKLFV